MSFDCVCVAVCVPVCVCQCLQVLQKLTYNSSSCLHTSSHVRQLVAFLVTSV